MPDAALSKQPDFRVELALPAEMREEIVARVAAALVAEGLRLLREELAERLDPLTPQRAAKMIGMTPETLGANHKKWGLVKSTALGSTNPRYSRRQITARLQGMGVQPRVLSAA